MIMNLLWYVTLSLMKFWPVHMYFVVLRSYGKELINYVDSINYLHMGGQATNTDNSKR